MRGPFPAGSIRRRASPALLSFNAGELSPSLEGRIDLEKYASGCRTLQNFLPRVQGGLLKRSGFRYVHEVKTTASITVEIAAEFGEDILSDGTEFPADGSDDGVGVVNIGGNKALRGAQRFDLSDVPPGVTISQVQIRVNIKAVVNVAAASWTWGRYGSVGDDAEPDAGSSAFTRADASQVPYATITSYRSTGLKTDDITSAAVKADIASAVNAGVPLTLALREVSESLASAHSASLDEYISANPPTLIVTYLDTRARCVPFEFNTTQAYNLVFGEQHFRVFKDEAVVLEPPKGPISTTNATPVVVTLNAHGYNNNDEVLIGGTGLGALDGRYWIVANKTANTFELQGSTAPGATASLGTASRIYEVATPYHASELDLLQWAQNADVMYLTHPSYAPRKLSRLDHDDWTLAAAAPDWFPFAPENADQSSFIGASGATGSVTLTASAGPFTSAFVGSYVRLREVIEQQHAEWKAETDYSAAGYAAFRAGANPAVGDQFHREGKVYEIIDKHGGSATTGQVAPVHEDGQSSDGRWDWQFVNYGSGYALITAVTDAWRATATVVKPLPKSCVTTDQSITAFNSLNPIQLTINGHGYETGDKVFIRGVSSTRGTALNNQVWTVTRVDANNFTVPVSGVGLAGVGGTATQVYWASNVNGSIAIFPSLNKWSFGAWSDVRGYPRGVSFFEDRLWFAGTDSDPQTLWASRTGRYEDFRETDEDDSALLLTLNTNTINVIESLIGQDALTIFTAGGEFLLRGGNDEPVTPGNVRATRKSTDGARAGIQPIAEGPATLFVQRAGRKVIELVSDLDTSSLIGVDLTLLADHITLGSVRAMAFQREPDRVLWVVLQDGSLLGFTYERAQQVTGWHRHPLGGTSAAVESVAVIPAPEGDRDQLWAVVRVTINGTARRFVEVLEPSWVRTQALAEAFFLDHGATYMGAPTTTIGGLYHLVGESVYALADGLEVGPFTVSAGGSITLAVAASQVHVGLLYQAVLETMRVEAGGADGTAQGKRKRVRGVVLRLDRTGRGLAIGSTVAETTQEVALPSGALTDGDTEAIPWPGGWEQTGRLAVRHALPTPCGITAILPVVETTD